MGRNTSTEEKDSIIPRDRDINPERGISFEVPYARSSINKCRCSQCPVQIDSKCVKDKLESSKTEMAKIPAGEVPDPKGCQGYIVQQAKPRVKTLTLTNNVFVTPVMFGKSTILKKRHHLNTSVKMA